jgi:hypothetical protein
MGILRPMGMQSVALDEVQFTAFETTAELPERHFWTRLFRGARFRRSAERFVHLLYSLEWKHFEDIEDFECAENLAQIVLSTIEIHMLRYTARDTGECMIFRNLIADLRIAIDGLRQGLPPNPAKRPSDQELEALASERLSRVLPIIGSGRVA